MKYRQICRTIYCFVALIVLFNVTNAQSKNIDSPTPLTSNEISGVVDSDTKGNTYYYSFWASPGEVSVTLTVTPGKAVNDSFLPALTRTTVEFRLLDRNAQELASKSAATNLDVGAKQAIARIEVTKRQLLVLAIKSPDDIFNFNSVNGKYRLRIDGDVEFGGSNSTNILREKINSFSCLPKQGTLIIKMKDGSKKIIDLSEAENVTVVP